MHCQQSRRKRLVVHTGKMVTRLFAGGIRLQKVFFVCLVLAPGKSVNTFNI